MDLSTKQIVEAIKQLQQAHISLKDLLNNNWHPALVNLIQENNMLKIKVKDLESAYAELLLLGSSNETDQGSPVRVGS